MPTLRSTAVSRRTMLGWVLATPLALAACSPEGQAPQTPQVSAQPPPSPPVTPTLPPVVDRDLLLQAWGTATVRAAQAQSAWDAVRAADTAPVAEPLLAGVTEAFTGQAQTLAALLQAAQVELPAAPSVPSPPTIDPDATSDPGDGSPTTAPSTMPSPAALVTALSQGCAMDADPERLVELADLAPENRPMLVALTASRAGWARVLGGAVQLAPLREQQGPQGAAAAAVLVECRRSVYLLEVLSARTIEENRAAYEEPLDRLRSLESALVDLAGGSAPAAPVAYRLPPLDTAAQRSEAVQASLAVLLTSAVAQSADAMSADEESLTGLVRIVADVMGLGARWQIGWEPFPGMSLPD